MTKEPIYQGLLQSNLDFAGFSPVNLTGWPPTGGGSALIDANVKAAPYNAVGDGVTDDTLAVQAAINDVVNGALATGAPGGSVFFPEGVYLCNGAFDATTNSVLKFPYVPILVSPGVYHPPVTIELRGETPSAVAAVPFVNGSIIKCTKTGTGTAPAILAAYTFVGRAIPADYTTAFSYVQVVVRNIEFQTGVDPTIHGLRLDAAVMAILEDVAISTGDGGAPAPTQPTHSTAGLWMPATKNFATNYLNRVWTAGFDTGLVASTEHFRAPHMNFLNCNVAAEFLSGGHIAWGNLQVDHCKTAVKFTDISGGAPGIFCLINLIVDIEQIDAGWQVPAAGGDILDSSNNARGQIRYWVYKIGVGHGTLGVTGGSNLRLIDFYDSNMLYIGTDLRFVPLTGGGKLQARNIGTNTWADVDQWTNP